jgi:heme/copper-type cytochrome/quinol oxidase subunit 2
MSRNGRIALVAAALVVAVAAFVVFKAGSDNGGSKPASSKPATPSATTKAPAPPVRRIEIQGGKPVGGVHKITVTKGDTLRLVVSSPDTSQEIHVHGYDLKRDMAPGHPASLRFKTNIEGVFEIELEDTATKIASLQVRPG